jgi:hypothetical protein
MSIMGDLRYLMAEDYAIFADGLSSQRRQTAFQDYSKQEAALGRAVDEAAWMKAHPPGFLERQEAFSTGGIYGRWLRGLPAILTVDASIFLHGGISLAVAVLSTDRINAQVRAEIQGFDKYKQFMIDKKLAYPFSTYDELLIAAQDEIIRNGEDRDPADLQTLEDFIHGAWLTTNEKGPLWFREYDTWSEDEGETNMTRMTEAFNVKRFVVGHTPQPNGEIRSRFGGKVFLIDTGLVFNLYNAGKAAALEIAGDRIRAIYLDKQTELN